MNCLPTDKRDGIRRMWKFVADDKLVNRHCQQNCHSYKQYRIVQYTYNVQYERKRCLLLFSSGFPTYRFSRVLLVVTTSKCLKSILKAKMSLLCEIKRTWLPYSWRLKFYVGGLLLVHQSTFSRDFLIGPRNNSSVLFCYLGYLKFQCVFKRLWNKHLSYNWSEIRFT